MQPATRRPMTRRTGVAIALASLLGCLSVGCIDAPLFIPLGEPSDAGDPSIPASDAASTADAASEVESGTGKPGPDAGTSCAERCPASGGTCEGETCIITCSSPLPCKGNKKCPAGLACRIVCEGKQACDKVDCASGTSCSVSCAGDQACNGDVRAEAPSARITCDGYQACNGKVECKGASCAISCGAQGCKPGEVKCCASQCTVDGVASTCKP